MTETSAPPLNLGEPADEAAWRALVDAGLKGASWDKLVARTSDGVLIEALYREPDFPTATDVSGFPGAAPFVRGAARQGWLIRQAFTHPDPERTNRDILADLAGGVAAIELVIDPSGENGVAIRDADDFNVSLAGVILEAAPVSLDAGLHGDWAAAMLLAKLKGVAPHGTAFNLDPIGARLRSGKSWQDDIYFAAHFTAMNFRDLPGARFLRADARPVHEAGGTEVMEIAEALASGITYLRELERKALTIEQSARVLSFAISVGPDVLVEAAKLRALRLCWARVLEASGAEPSARAAHIHAFTSRRMLTRYDAWTNIVRISSAAFAAAIGGADAITTTPFTDALGLPTPFARRIARNTQLVLLEEAHLGQVADPAGGAWFVEKLTRDLAEAAWTKMQSNGDALAELTAAREARESRIATRRETITGVTDFPLLDAAFPEVERASYNSAKDIPDDKSDPEADTAPLAPIRWAAPFEALRDRAEAVKPRPSMFFANIGPIVEFGPRASFVRNLFAAGGVGAIGSESAHETPEALLDAFKRSSVKVAVLCASDAHYAEQAENTARALRSAGCTWLVLAGKVKDEAELRAAGVDQFVFAGQDALKALSELHAALGIAL